MKAFATDGTTAAVSAAVTVANTVPSAPPPLRHPEPLGRADGQRLGPWTATTSGRTVSKVDFSVNGQVVATDSTAPYATTYDSTRVSERHLPLLGEGVRDRRNDGSRESAAVTVRNTRLGPAHVASVLG